MRKLGVVLIALGLATVAFGDEREPRLPAGYIPGWSHPHPSGGRGRHGRHGSSYYSGVSGGVYYDYPGPVAYAYPEPTPTPYMAWVSTAPSHSSTYLGPGGTVGSFAGNDPADTAHWYRFWLEPGEPIHWKIASSNPASTRYSAALYQDLDGYPGRRLARTTGAYSPDSLLFRNGPGGTYVFLRLALAWGDPKDCYLLWGIRPAPREEPVFLSQFALNGAVQNGNQISDGVEAEMLPGVADDWYYWYWPGEIDGRPVAAMKLDLAYDSTRTSLDLFALTPLGDTLLARTDGPHYSAGTGWLTKETGWIYRSPEDTTGIWLRVHANVATGTPEAYRINSAIAMTPDGEEIVYAYYPYPGGVYYYGAYGWYDRYGGYGGYEEEGNYYYRGRRGSRGRDRESPPPPPPSKFRAILEPVRGEAPMPIRLPRSSSGMKSSEDRVSPPPSRELESSRESYQPVPQPVRLPQPVRQEQEVRQEQPVHQEQQTVRQEQPVHQDPLTGPAVR